MGEHALNNPKSSAFAAFYEFLLTSFIEADEKCKGTINREEFDLLLTNAAKVPRMFGLAPPTVTKSARDAIFDKMDENQEGYVTFRKFLSWTIEHTKEVLALHRA